MRRRWKKVAFSFVLASALALIGACAKAPEPQEACNFVMNSQRQRVSWGDHTPVTLYIDDSVPGPFIGAIENAVEQWNRTLGRQVLKIGGWTNKEGGPSRDNANIIYWLNEWEEDRPFEQARTTVYWAGDQIYEADIRINDKNFDYGFGETPLGGTVDLESLVVHELGHVLGLTHTEQAQSVMARSLSSATLRRVPSKVDVDSIRCEY